MLCFYIKGWEGKFQARVAPCVGLGYPFGQKAYKLLNLKTHKVFVSRDVVFRELVFPYKLISLGQFRSLFHFHNSIPSRIDFPSMETSTSQPNNSSMTLENSPS